MRWVKLVLATATVLILAVVMWQALQAVRPKGEVLRQDVRLYGDVKVYELEWSPGVYRGYRLENGTAKPYDLKTKYLVRVIVPKGAKKLLVYAAHTERVVKSLKLNELAKVAKDTSTILLFYGEEEADWKTLGFRDRGELMRFSLLTATSGRGNFGKWLGEVMSKAITLGLEIASREGLKVGTVGVAGKSKEGYAAWLTALHDDRVEVAIPGNFRMESFQDFLAEAIREWGCKNPHKQWALASYYPHPDVLMALNSTTRIRDVMSELDRLRAKFLLILGEVDLSEWHDAKYFPLLAENNFLSELERKGVEFRYVRKRPGWRVNEASLLIAALYYNDLLDRWPKVLKVTHELKDGNLKVQAWVKGAQEVRLVVGTSSNPAWNDGDERWAAVPMRPEGDHYVAELKVNLSKFMVFYVEALTLGRLPLMDSSPYQVVNWPYNRTCDRPDYETLKKFRQLTQP